MKYLHSFRNYNELDDYMYGDDYLQPFVARVDNQSGITYNRFDTRGITYVNLGLGQGTLWATTNIGASSPEQYGNLYSFGEVMTKERYTYSNYLWKGSSNEREPSKYTHDDWKFSLDPEDDAACVIWGGNWHIPDKYQIQALVDGTNFSVETVNGVSCAKFTSKTNGKYIYIPFSGLYDASYGRLGTGQTGYLWTDTVCWDLDDYQHSYHLYFNSGHAELGSTSVYRSCGMAIRPVIGRMAL